MLGYIIVVSDAKYGVGRELTIPRTGLLGAYYATNLPKSWLLKLWAGRKAPPPFSFLHSRSRYSSHTRANQQEYRRRGRPKRREKYLGTAELARECV